MRVQVKFLATIRGITGEPSTELLCNPRDTARTLMRKLVKKYGQKFEQVTLEGTNLKPAIKILINGRDIDYFNGLDTQLKDGCYSHNSSNCGWVKKAYFLLGGGTLLVIGLSFVFRGRITNIEQTIKHRRRLINF